MFRRSSFHFFTRFLPGCPGLSWPWLITGLSHQSPFFSIATALLSSFFLDLLVGCSSTWRCAYEHFSQNWQPLLVQENKHSEKCHLSQNELFNPCKAIETFYHWDFFLWDFEFSMIFAHSAAWKNSETHLTVSFFHAYWHRGGNCNCILWSTARWTPIANNLQDSLYTLFCPLILNHGVSLKISASGPKVLISNFLFDTSLHHSF